MSKAAVFFCSQTSTPDEVLTNLWNFRILHTKCLQKQLLDVGRGVVVLAGPPAEALVPQRIHTSDHLVLEDGDGGVGMGELAVDLGAAAAAADEVLADLDEEVGGSGGPSSALPAAATRRPIVATAVAVGVVAVVGGARGAWCWGSNPLPRRRRRIRRRH